LGKQGLGHARQVTFVTCADGPRGYQAHS